MKKIGIVLVLLLCMLIGACGMSAVQTIAEQNGELKIWFQSNSGSVSSMIIVDDKTGVNYIAIGTTYANDGGLAITPRLNADGTLYTSK